MTPVACNLGGGMVETFAHPYGGQVQVIIPTKIVKIVPESQVKNVQQLVDIPQVGPVAVVTIAVPPPPAAYFKSQGDFVSLVNEYIEPPATKTLSNLDSQALSKKGGIVAPKIRRSVSCPARIRNIYATNFPCLCDRWSVPASARTVCKFGSRGRCHDEIVFGVLRMNDCRRCHSDRCAALYRCFQDGMYRRTTKQKLNRQARHKRQRLAITSLSQESASTIKL
jgi:hypothetical protein